MSRETVIEGRVRLITDRADALIADIDTDQIFHNAHLAITDISEMGRHTFGNLEGWEDFPKTAMDGDIVIVGENFGAGSSRQQAVDCFISLEVQAIVGRSFGAIYWRNAVNAGFPVLSCPDIQEAGIREGDRIRIDLLTGEIRRAEAYVASATPFSKVQSDIHQAGGLLGL